VLIRYIFDFDRTIRYKFLSLKTTFKGLISEPAVIVINTRLGFIVVIHLFCLSRVKTLIFTHVNRIAFHEFLQAIFCPNGFLSFFIRKLHAGFEKLFLALAALVWE
jgi:hypothetical protein